MPGTGGLPSGAPPARRRGLLALTLAIVAIVALVGLVVGVGRMVLQRATEPQAGPPNGAGTPVPAAPDSQPASPPPTTTGGQVDAAAVASGVNPAVVDVNTTLGLRGAQAAGTGIVLTSSGEVLTNNHVINGATSIHVTDVGNGRTYRATVVGYDLTDDVAVLRMQNASGLRTVSIGDSGAVNSGDPVVAIGNAGGTGGAPTVVGGTVTALDQSITASDEADGTSQQLDGLIQIAANIQPGDSGGPLVNASGKVIGMDTAASAGGLSQGDPQGFAIPINKAMSIAHQIEAGTASSTVHIGSTAFLGVQVGTPRRAESTVAGAQVLGVVDGSPAQRVGITTGDVIVSVNGQTIDSGSTLTALLQQYRPGNSVRVTWVDAGGNHTAAVQLTTGPAG